MVYPFVLGGDTPIYAHSTRTELRTVTGIPTHRLCTCVPSGSATGNSTKVDGLLGRDWPLDSSAHHDNLSAPRCSDLCTCLPLLALSKFSGLASTAAFLKGTHCLVSQQALKVCHYKTCEPTAPGPNDTSPLSTTVIDCLSRTAFRIVSNYLDPSWEI